MKFLNKSICIISIESPPIHEQIDKYKLLSIKWKSIILKCRTRLENDHSIEQLGIIKLFKWRRWVCMNTSARQSNSSIGKVMETNIIASWFHNERHTHTDHYNIYLTPLSLEPFDELLLLKPMIRIYLPSYFRWHDNFYTRTPLQCYTNIPQIWWYRIEK